MPQTQDLPQNPSSLHFSEHKEGDDNSRVNGKVPLISKHRVTQIAQPLGEAVLDATEPEHHLIA